MRAQLGELLLLGQEGRSCGWAQKQGVQHPTLLYPWPGPINFGWLTSVYWMTMIHKALCQMQEIWGGHQNVSCIALKKGGWHQLGVSLHNCAHLDICLRCRELSCLRSRLTWLLRRVPADTAVEQVLLSQTHNMEASPSPGCLLRDAQNHSSLSVHSIPQMFNSRSVGKRRDIFVQP